MSWRRSSMSIFNPWSRAVCEVIGPMLAACICFGQGSPSARKFSTVEELVKVIRSAPSSKNRRRAPVISRVSGTVRYAKASSTIAPRLESSLGSTSRAFSARAIRIRLCHEIGGLKVDVEMKIADSLGGRWPDGRDFSSANLAGVVVKLEKHLEERVDTIRARKHDPIISMRVLD